MQYSVPQFIDVEDKVVGPFTGKQALFMIIGFGVLLIAFTFFRISFFLIIAIPTILLTLAFAFWRPKGFTVSRWITNIINFYTTPHLYIWRREPDSRMFKLTQRKQAPKEIQATQVSKNRINELAWLLDTSTSVSMPYEAKARPGEKM
ncbi:MAG: PrgI family protein [Candidatus Andersenbacteria bacterium]|nr:PrgI family protein [Candidatus Andersenbacteria bacterium]